MREKISNGLARRIALAAQGFADAAPAGVPDRRHLARVLSRTGLLQIDSVSAVVRAHYMPLYSRLGPYPLSLLDDATGGRRRTLFEYWAHEASFLPVETWPLLRWRMERAARGEEIYSGLAKWGRSNEALIESIYRQVVERGPIASSDIEGHKGKGGWWGWSEAKHAFEWLFWAGRVTTASRRGFERLYDLPERVLPRKILDLPTPSPEDAHRELLRISTRAHGVATYACLRDYFRLAPADTRARIEELVEEGELLPVAVEEEIVERAGEVVGQYRDLLGRHRSCSLSAIAAIRCSDFERFWHILVRVARLLSISRRVVLHAGTLIHMRGTRPGETHPGGTRPRGTRPGGIGPGRMPGLRERTIGRAMALRKHTA